MNDPAELTTIIDEDSAARIIPCQMIGTNGLKGIESPGVDGEAGRPGRVPEHLRGIVTSEIRWSQDADLRHRAPVVRSGDGRWKGARGGDPLRTVGSTRYGVQKAGDLRGISSKKPWTVVRVLPFCFPKRPRCTARGVTC